jgi:hypothetical protein
MSEPAKPDPFRTRFYLTQWLYWYENHSAELEGQAYDDAVELAAATRAVLYQKAQGRPRKRRQAGSMAGSS